MAGRSDGKKNSPFLTVKSLRCWRRASAGTFQSKNNMLKVAADFMSKV
jgi:hypothetical protein